MARDILYLSNLTEDITEEDLRDLFAKYGEITLFEFGHNEKFNVRTALVQMAAEKQATKAMHSLNGTLVADNHLYISYPTPDPKYYEQGLSSKARKTAEAIVTELGEEYRKPVRRVHTMVLVCGHSFVQAVLAEAREVHEGEGMLTYDGSRKRNLGGVFFTLANRYLSPTMYSLIHNRGGKLPNYQKEDDRAFYHLIVNPHEEDVEA